MADPGPPTRTRRHLMDPNAPRPVRDHASEAKSLSRVQRWVMSALAVTTIFHLVMGLILAPCSSTTAPRRAQWLCAIAGAFGVIAIAVAFTWSTAGSRSPRGGLVGLIPSAIGIFIIYR